MNPPIENPSRRLNRRDFTRAGVLGLAALSASRVLGANDGLVADGKCRQPGHFGQPCAKFGRKALCGSQLRLFQSSAFDAAFNGEPRAEARRPEACSILHTPREAKSPLGEGGVDAETRRMLRHGSRWPMLTSCTSPC